jgi:hypothetical protein
MLTERLRDALWTIAGIIAFIVIGTVIMGMNDLAWIVVTSALRAIGLY